VRGRLVASAVCCCVAVADAAALWLREPRQPQRSVIHPSPGADSAAAPRLAARNLCGGGRGPAQACRKVRAERAPIDSIVARDIVDTDSACGHKLERMVAGKQDRSKAAALRLIINERPW